MFKLVVLSCVLAVAFANGIAPLGWAGQGWGGWAGNGLAVPLAASVAVAAPVLGASNYRGPLSLAPGQPANILAADGRPLDTLSVNLDRAAHLTARALEGAHVLRKRSAVLAAAPVAWSGAAGVVAAPLVAPVAAAPLAGAWGRAAGWGNAGAWGRGAGWGHAGAWGAPLW